ncbi:hypothetical protein CHLRE_13g563250v5 [Chlamydomonas reinhardtii]|uniref:Uncharacterized protein n=1 Tax=Chlamydomonas reinhardtii TaxID=3055 RepID=A0A2K3CZ26_CHLRE|nr:uncharacterized protein CHLRE_13g563250v5 [Chlamydomonas reinhardtii]PNW73540.1 hypothetical protein CHLRE_13g563250v5 [Chlamydomonas reinhardtii]
MADTVVRQLSAAARTAVLAAALLLLLGLAPAPLLQRGGGGGGSPCRWALGVSAEQTDRQVNSDGSLFAALTNPAIRSIGVAHSGASLAPYAQALYNAVASHGPLQLNRSLTLYGATAGASLDFAYVAGVVRLAPATTLTLKGLQLYRAQALRAPLGLLATSPGASVVIQDCTNNQQVCWPHEAAQAYFLRVFARPFPGSQQAALCAPGSEATCRTYTFTDIGFFVNPSPEFGTGGYTLRYLNTLIACQAYPDPVPTCPSLAADITQPPPAPYTCLASVYDPASQRALCPTCACINGCRRGCDAAGLSGPTTAAC